MKATAIRRELHNYLEVADDKKLKAIYTMVEDEIKATKSHWDDPEFIREIASREVSYLDGSAKTYSWEEVQKKAKVALKKAKNKL